MGVTRSGSLLLGGRRAGVGHHELGVVQVAGDVHDEGNERNPVRGRDVPLGQDVAGDAVVVDEDGRPPP